MDLISWRESYETGINSMDVEHQKLIELINKLYRVIRKDESSDSVQEVFVEMSKYADSHLRSEENILEANGYPDFANHVALHQNYLDKMKTLTAESNQDNYATVKESYLFLRKWWMEHIVNEDKKYGEFLKSKGIK